MAEEDHSLDTRGERIQFIATPWPAQRTLEDGPSLSRLIDTKTAASARIAGARLAVTDFRGRFETDGSWPAATGTAERRLREMAVRSVH